MFIIGIDVGGTNTDAVLVKASNHEIITSIKTPTTKDVYTGISNSFIGLMSSPKLKDSISSEQIAAVIIGTTAFLNAVIEESDELAKVNVIRLCGPSSRDYPPFTDWPLSLEAKIKGETYMVNGGYQFDREEISELNEQEIEEIGQKIIQNSKDSNLINLVISGIFSILDPNQENRCARILAPIFQKANINYFFTLSNSFGTIGLLERESASILNASLRPLAYKTIISFEKSLENYKIPKNRLFLTKNDGTLTSLEFAKTHPI